MAGVPALTILGFIITCRWRRARERGYSGSKVIVDETDVEPSSRQRKSARFSSFFGATNGNGCADRDGKKRRRQAYASSVHSSAGMAGVGAHRGESGKVVPPTIQYVKISEVGMGLEVERKTVSLHSLCLCCTGCGVFQTALKLNRNVLSSFLSKN